MGNPALSLLKRYVRFSLSERITTALWLLLWVAILCAGLWPLQFHPANGAKWLPSESGIAFRGRGIAYSSTSFADLIGAGKQFPHPFTLELLLRPRAQSSAQLGIIACDNSSETDPHFLLAQYRTILILEARFWDPHRVLLHKLGADRLIPGNLVHVAVSSGSAGTRLYVDGDEAARSPLSIASETVVGPLVVGNSGSIGDPWNGDLLGLVVYDAERTAAQVLTDAQASLAGKPEFRDAAAGFDLSDRSGESAHNDVKRGSPLLVPATLVLLRRTVLAWDFRPDAAGFEDVMLNIAGFLPFGYLGAAVLSHSDLRRGIASVIILGFLLSLGIELVQSYMPLRSSSSTDLLMNTTGTTLGAIAFLLTWNHQRNAAHPL